MRVVKVARRRVQIKLDDLSLLLIARTSVLVFFASVDLLDVGIPESIAVGVTLLFFTDPARSSEKAQSAIADTFDFLATVFELDLDGGGFTFAKYSRYGAVEHPGRHGVAYLVVFFEVRTMTFLHSQAPRLILTGRGFCVCIRAAPHFGQVHLRCL
jgi:hypothetical protein